MTAVKEEFGVIPGLASHLRSDRVGVEFVPRGVEGFDVGGEGGVFLGDNPLEIWV